MKTKIRLSLFLLFLFTVVLLPLQIQAGYEDGQECWNCGHYHWDEYMHECGACSPDCTNDWCALETHCHRCGGCLNGDYPCDECGLCKECMAEIGHCSQCDTCWMDYGADDVLCGNCRRCEFCSPICPECGMCEDCADDPSDGMHCPECGNCYQVTEQCEFVENNHCKECCEPCEQCGECVAGDHLETCPYCGLCVECCEFNSMMEGCEDGSICVYDLSEWDEHVCGVCLNFFQSTSDLCETCVDAGEYRCKDCCELASECSEYMCEYDDEYEDHFCIDCGECFHDVNRCETCEENRCESCCAARTEAVYGCTHGICADDSYFEDHLHECEDVEGFADEHDCTPSNRWSCDETGHWRECRFCDDDTDEEIAQAHLEETFEIHKTDANGKCVVCGYVKGSKVSITRQPKSVSAKVSIAGADESNPYHVKNNTVTLRAAAKVFNGSKDDLGYNWYARVTDQNGNEIFNGAVEEMFRNDCFKDEYRYGAVYNGFDSPELTISVPYRACQWKYVFWCRIDTVDSKGDVVSTIETDEVQIKAGHLYTVCENVTGSGASTTLRYKDTVSGETSTITIKSSDGHKWYCVGCKHTDKTIKTAKGQPVMHRYGESVLRGESVTHPGAMVYGKKCRDCGYITYYETHNHVYFTEESDFEKYNRGSFQVNEEKTTDMAHALVCLVDGCDHIKMESHEWDWRHMGYGSDVEGGGIFYRECRICGYPDYDYRPVDEDGNKIGWTTKNVLVTAINAQVSRTLAVEDDALTLTINNNEYTIGKHCTGWTVEYTTPYGIKYDITSAYTILQNGTGTWDTVIKLSGYTTGGILLFTPIMVDCTNHEYVTEGYVAPVCMYDGFAGYRVCKYCHVPDPVDSRPDEERVLPAESTVHTGTKLPLYEKEVVSSSGKTTITWTTDKNESTTGRRYNYKKGNCTEKGCEGDFLCSACEHVISGKRDYSHPHLVTRNQSPFSCFKNGYSGDEYCEDCGKLVNKGYVIEAPKKHETLLDVDGSAIVATCTVQGKEADQWCLVCDEVFSGKAIHALGHDWVKDEENCTKDTTAYACSRCDAKRFEAVNTEKLEKYAVSVTGGYAYIVKGVPVFKAAEGSILTLKAAEAEDLLFKEWEVVIGGIVIENPTLADGATFTMPANKVEINAVFENHEHNFVWIVDKEPTIYENGFKHEECTGCGAKRNENTVLDKLSGGFDLIYIPRTCTLTFDTNGGDSLTRRAVLYGESIDLAKYVPVRERYTFIGWYSDKTLTKQVFTLEMKTNTTIYAGWEKTEVFPFGDVTESDRFYEDIAYVWKTGLMVGVGENTFASELSLSRAMIVTILYRLEGEPEVGRCDFTDVAEGMWYTDAIAWAQSSGIVNGYGNGCFGPEDFITREQLSAIFDRYLTYTGNDVRTLQEALAAYPDSADISAWAVSSVNWAVGEGFLPDDEDGTLAPTANATRAQTAAFLHRFAEKYGLPADK